MADLDLSLWLTPPPRRFGFGLLPARALPRTVQVELLDEDDNPVAEPVDVDVPEPVRMEVPSGGAGFEWKEARPPLSLPLDSGVAGAAKVRARAGSRILGFAPLTTASVKPGPPADRRVFNAGGAWKLLLVSERFADANSFFAAAGQLHDFIMGMAPFSEDGVGDRLQTEALFWPSGPKGLFNVKFDGRLAFGDNERVMKFVRKSGSQGRLVFVVINSNVRGGAGGTREAPAWATITSEATERWEAVALHELGHAFGLADEYSHSSQKTPEPGVLEPNVSRSRKASETAWAALCTPGVADDPTCNSVGQPVVPAGTIGTFEGARYEPRGRFRPTANCLMRETNQPFCPVCQAAIRRVLAEA